MVVAVKKTAPNAMTRDDADNISTAQSKAKTGCKRFSGSRVTIIPLISRRLRIALELKRIRAEGEYKVFPNGLLAYFFIAINSLK